MWDWADETVFNVIEWMPVLDSELMPIVGAPEFNYFFTLIAVFGIISVGFVTIQKMITRS